MFNVKTLRRHEACLSANSLLRNQSRIADPYPDDTSPFASSLGHVKLVSKTITLHLTLSLPPLRRILMGHKLRLGLLLSHHIMILIPQVFLWWRMREQSLLNFRVLHGTQVAEDRVVGDVLFGGEVRGVGVLA